MAQFLNHLHVVLYTFLDALGLDGVAQLLEESHLFHQIVLNMADGEVSLFLCRHKEIGRVKLVGLKSGHALHGDSIQFLDGVYFVIPERDTKNNLTISHSYIDSVALDSETTTLQFNIVSDVKCGNQFS